MDHPKDIEIKDYDYPLPEERIARYPLAERDASKLLIYQSGHIRERIFKQVAEALPSGALLLFNDSRVIRARLQFSLPNDKTVEVFCLEPALPADYQQNFSSTEGVTWYCMIGNNRHWKSGPLTMSLGGCQLFAERRERTPDAFEVYFHWTDPALSFGEVLALAGSLPLPPYLGRPSEATDEQRYQTIYAREEGSVAAPTAGLHFTDEVFAALDQKNIERLFVTLHVGAGTFRPVKSDTMGGHDMHEEMIIIRREAIAAMAAALRDGRAIIAVGTTSMRVLESLYWHGLAQEPNLQISQWAPYETPSVRPATEVLDALLARMTHEEQHTLQGHTQLIIAPGYRFRIASGLITNFHQPRSTLLLLIAAWAGQDWRRIYQHALDNDFRFLSYGDSSLLM
jgi:S-adenosylmethionine:tRNA ribosyltransferase-isomerase